MPSDYTRIREDNIREYGEGTRHLDFLQRLYADRTHFIFELLQNAEDAGASRVTFALHADRLVVEHDGRPFNEQDVRGICGVDASTKTGELTSIGKFGIGFKSVYAYTRSPEVHSESEHFRIQHYVRPEHAECPADLDPDLTRFVFPFDRDDASSHTAHSEIGRGLERLDPVALLFLGHVGEVAIRGERGVTTLSRDARGGRSPDVELKVHENGRVTKHQYWRVYRRPLDHIGHPGQRVEVAFKLTGPGPDALVERVPRAPLVVYFPTDKPTGLGFLLQAPLRTTPARDNIPEHEPDNATIVAEAAQLLVDALEEMRCDSRLGLDVFEVLPVTPEAFPEGSLLRPLFDALRDAVQTRPLLPIAGPMRHAPASRVRLARVRSMQELLTPTQLGALTGVAEKLYWQPEQLTENRSPALWSYLRNTLGVAEVTPEWVVSQLSTGFLASAEDEWLIRLYRFLAQSPALWREPRGHWDRPGPARTMPLIRLEDGRHVVPFGSDNRPRAYLPRATPSSFPTVRRAIVADQDARAFLQRLGFTEPNAVDEVIMHVLPRYQGWTTSGDEDQHDADVAAILHALQTAGGSRRTDLLKELRETAFLLCRSADGTTYSYQRPSIAYWPDPDLEHYFLPSEHGWFLHERYQRYRRQLSELGVADRVRFSLRPTNPQGHVVIWNFHSNHRRGLHGFDPDLNITGLDAALASPDQERSAYVWNQLLLPHANRLRGVVESSSRQDYSNSERADTTSTALEVAAAHAWLPTEDGSFVEPAMVSLDDLPDDFTPNQALADALGLRTSTIEQASAEFHLPVDFLQFVRKHPERAAEMMQRLRYEWRAVDDADKKVGAGLTPAGYADALQGAFDKAPVPAESRVDLPSTSGTVQAPAIRRQRTAEAILQDLTDEPAPRDRFRVLGRKVWDDKDPAVRQFLLKQYDGRCQICAATFPKRDGTPYFEVLRLVSHTAAAWIDRQGNALCLCPTCTSKFLHGHVASEDLLEQLLQWRTSAEGGSDNGLRIELCGQPVVIRYTEKHLLDLQEMVTIAGA
ncbi:hypothetical protein V6U89_00500 [Micromonospora sp. CPCC 206171]|uniref:sacsin N-terminal ATP-binding-like domain-containing protein n=1 Tax=Micromonospora sp. CPCC 206171 TaxID=3122405 RepID=UPI002FEF2F47